MDLSYQLYSSREESDVLDVLKHLAATGYSQVEGWRGAFADTAAFKAALAANGLTMPTAHLGIEDLEADPEGMASMAKDLGVSTVYAPFLMPDDRPTDVAGWQAFGARLEAMGEKMRALGLNFGWHNHDFEFFKLEEGSTPMQHILESAPSIEWEADVAWIVRGDADPVAWLTNYADRITSLHVKDIAPAGENLDEDGWADVGEGVMDWAGLLKLATTKTRAKVFVMEHDKPSDPRRFAERAFANVSKMSA